jgi:site-specific DNA-methyltransferase (adenine-specific)
MKFPKKSKGNESAVPYKTDGMSSRPNPEGRIKRCVWSISTKPFPEAHFAVFPETLVQQCLDAGCPSSDGIVLDPFMGSGTVALVALKNHCRFIGIELNQNYIEIALKRIEPYLYQTKLV